MDTETYVKQWGSEQAREAARKALAQGLEQGRVQGRAQDVVRILTARQIAVTAAERDRILATTDIAQLDLWFDRALTAATAEDLFG